jgi:hypothetical protein
VGYRSDVAYAVKLSLLPEDILRKFIDYADTIEMKVDEGEVYILFIINNIKWPDVDLPKEVEPENFRLIVIGEFRDDMEDTGELEVFDLGISREIIHTDGIAFDPNKNYDNIKADILPNSEEFIFNKIRKIKNELRSYKDE